MSFPRRLAYRQAGGNPGFLAHSFPFHPFWQQKGGAQNCRATVRALVLPRLILTARLRLATLKQLVSLLRTVRIRRASTGRGQTLGKRLWVFVMKVSEWYSIALLIQKSMDVFSHGLWSATLAKATNLSTKKVELNPWHAAWWGVFPDVFAFSVPMAVTLFGLLTGTVDRSGLPGPGSSAGARPVFGLALYLYNYSHSLIVFALVFGVIFGIRFLRHREKMWYSLVPWTMLAWMLHILADIPTHSTEFYPTPFLWPFSSFRVNGYPWAHPVFMITNYSLLVIVSIILFIKKRQLKKQPQK